MRQAEFVITGLKALDREYYYTATVGVFEHEAGEIERKLIREFETRIASSDNREYFEIKDENGFYRLASATEEFKRTHEVVWVNFSDSYLPHEGKAPYGFGNGIYCNVRDFAWLRHLGAYIVLMGKIESSDGYLLGYTALSTVTGKVFNLPCVGVYPIKDITTRYRHWEFCSNGRYIDGEIPYLESSVEYTIGGMGIGIESKAYYYLDKVKLAEKPVYSEMFAEFTGEIEAILEVLPETDYKRGAEIKVER